MNEIADILGVSTDKVRRLSKMPNMLIYKNQGGYCAFDSDWAAWQRQKQT